MLDFINVISQFRIEGAVESISPIGNGLINETLRVTTVGTDTPDYILQRINDTVFTDVVLLHYKVEEDCVRAVSGTDLGPVWEDSCCEFFCCPDTEGGYYNLEANCIGTVLLCNGKGRENRTPASHGTLADIDRWASLGREPFGTRDGRQAWELALAVPVSSFFRHTLKSLSGQTVSANFYKCGDKTRQPHFLSWNPISLPAPDFHCPEFFGEVTFL